MHIVVEVYGNTTRNICQSDSWTNAFTTAYAWSKVFKDSKYIAISDDGELIARYIDGRYVV